jgi:ribosomal protein S27AE
MTEGGSERLVVNGQSLEVVGASELLAFASRQAPLNAFEHWLSWTAAFITRSAGAFALARYEVGPKRRSVWLVLANVEGTWTRVQLLSLSCAKCGAQVLGATPDCSDLYIGLPDKWDVLDATLKLRTQNCPQCGAKLPVRFVWAQLDDEQ